MSDCKRTKCYTQNSKADGDRLGGVANVSLQEHMRQTKRGRDMGSYQDKAASLRDNTASLR